MKKQAPSTTSKAKKEATGLGKYAGLIVLIVLFLILTVGMLATSAYITQRIADESNAITVATRQTRLIQQVSGDSMDLDIYVADVLKANHDKEHTNPATEVQAASAAVATDVRDEETITRDDLPQDALYIIEDLKEVRTQFDEALTAFEKGGEIDLGYGKVAIEPLTSEEGVAKLDEIRRTWNPYMGLIDSFLTDVQNNRVNADTSRYMVDYARIYTDNLMRDSFIVNQLISERLAAQTAFWNKVQLGGIVAAFILFALIVFGSLRQLLDNDRKLSIANREMSEIMSSVNEGLFLVDKDLVIGGQYSKRLEEIIDQQNLGNKNLMDVLEKLVPQDDVETTKVFIDQLYSDWVVEDLIEDLNPLHRISVSDEGGKLKFLDFKFFRVWLNDKIERVLVSVTDSTESVQLQASLEAQKEQEGRELEMLNIILNTNPVILNSFIQNTVPRLEDINQTLKSPGEQKYELRNKIEHIARLIHSVKGEASSLKLNRMVGICEIFEDSLGDIKNSPNLSGRDFLGLIVLLEDLYQLFDVLKNYNKHMVGGLQQTMAANKPQTPQEAAKQFAQAQESHFKQFVNDIAARYGKQVNLVLEGFDNPAFNIAQWDKLKDIAIQLLRNSVVHGIEQPEIRRQRNKQAAGTLKLALSQQTDGNWLLTSEDDGNGIDFEAIRQKAIASGLVKPEQAASLEQRQLLSYMFSSGFSTASQETEDAGRGVGMDIIKSTIQGMGGKISVASRPETYTRFSLSFPKAQ